MFIKKWLKCFYQGPFKTWFLRFEQILLNNRTYFYGDRYGSYNLFLLLLKNSLRPQRIFEKFFYGQIFHLPFFITKQKKLQKAEKKYEIKYVVQTLREKGIIILPDYNKYLAKQITKKYNIDANYWSQANSYQMLHSVIDPLITEFLLDEYILSIIGNYYKSQPFINNLATINVSYPNVNLQESEEQKPSFNYWWHYDDTNQVSVHFLLSNNSCKDTRMLLAQNSHKRHHQYLFGDQDYYYSEEYVRKHHEIINCIGTQGTVIIFDSNCLHRIHPIKNNFRSHLHINYTPGNKYFSVSKENQEHFYQTLFEVQKKIYPNRNTEKLQFSKLQMTAFEKNLLSRINYK